MLNLHAKHINRIYWYISFWTLNIKACRCKQSTWQYQTLRHRHTHTHTTDFYLPVIPSIGADEFLSFTSQFSDRFKCPEPDTWTSESWSGYKCANFVLVNKVFTPLLWFRYSFWCNHNKTVEIDDSKSGEVVKKRAHRYLYWWKNFRFHSLLFILLQLFSWLLFGLCYCLLITYFFTFLWVSFPSFLSVAVFFPKHFLSIRYLCNTDLRA